MASRNPPSQFDGRPHAALISAGTRLWRVHRSDSAVVDFNHGIPGPAEGGRFDATEADPYPYWYGAYEQATALVEALLRDLPADDANRRYLQHALVRGRRLSAAVTTVELRVISLVTATDLAAAGVMGNWLVEAEAEAFPETRKWSGWLRTLDPAAAGLVWQSRKDRPNHALMLFGDRVGGGSGTAPIEPCPALTVALDTEDGVNWLNEMLRLYRVRVAPPP